MPPFGDFDFIDGKHVPKTNSMRFPLFRPKNTINRVLADRTAGGNGTRMGGPTQDTSVP